MQRLYSFQQWYQHVRNDPARIGSFGRFVLRRYLDDRLFESAGALSYTTAFALVPLAMVVFGVLSAFPMFDSWGERLTGYIFANFVPSSAQAISSYLADFSSNTSKLTSAGALALIISLLVTLNSVEAVFNRIWRVPTARPKISRFLVYWTVLTLGTLVAAASVALSTRFFALAIFETEPGQWLEAVMLRVAPMVIELLAFAALFKVVPHHTVRWRHAFAGALLAMLLFEAVKSGLSLYLGSFDSYQKIYGAVALVPSVMLWIYLSWVAILLGASFASSMSAFRYQPKAQRLPHGHELTGLLRMLGRFQVARVDGEGLTSAQIQQLEPGLTDSMLQLLLSKMAAINVVQRAENGEWLLARDLDEVPLRELYEAAQLRVPMIATLPEQQLDALGIAVAAVLTQLREPLQMPLQQPVSTIYQGLIANEKND
ncbi:MAG: YihY family inner membrane protein [Thermomonas sp.]|uniref:YihY family inner membrane protein n=1 Tax=Thermomonas sp. TaxID=1971895 RepID=UPI001ED41AEC|nr:YihY family inner membrane protein [Thermomonas sp.]MBV2208276.1 YihY family inner membrane protein [Thermomonas sp.]